MAVLKRATKTIKPIISKATGLPVDPKRSRAAKKAAATRKANALIADNQRSLRFHHKLVAGTAVLAVLVFTFFGIRGQLEAYAATTATGTFVGIGGKCLDNSGARLQNNNRIQLYTCNGTVAQKWVLTSTGSLKANAGANYCIDVPGNTKAEYTYIRLYTCNDTAAQHFTVKNNTLVGNTTGFCATDHYAETTNGNKIWMKACHGSDAQKWTYSGTTSGNSGSIVTPPTSGSGSGSNSGSGSSSGGTVVTGSGGDTGGNGSTQSGSGITAYGSLTGADFSKKINSSGTGNYASLPAGTYTFNDFAYGTQGKSGSGAQGVGAYGTQINNSKGILGAGSKYTTIQMKPNSSTKRDYVPPEAANGAASARTNQLEYMLVQESSFKLDGVKIVGTNQGHLYNGLMLNGISNLNVSDTTVTSVPGNDSGPPGETFSLNFYNQPAGGTANFTNVTMDGSKVAAVGIGLNSDKGTMTFKNLLTENTAYSAGVAGWQMSGTDNYYNWVNVNSVRSYNAERHSGTSNFYDPVWGQPTAGHYDINYTWESGWRGGSINFYFSNDAAWQKYIANRSTKKITIVTNPHGQGDIRSTVHVFVGGKEQSQGNYVQFSGAAS